VHITEVMVITIPKINVLTFFYEQQFCLQKDLMLKNIYKNVCTT